MRKITAHIVEQVKTYVSDILDHDLSEACVFHTWDHTLDVYNNSLIIGKECGFSDDEIRLLAVSALFHDVGYTRMYDGHEEASVLIARGFLSAMDIDNYYIEQLEKAILATKVPQLPEDSISEALCDADLMHLSYSNYFERIELMRMEWNLSGRADLNECEFHQQSIVFFNSHSYHTKYGREILALKKQLNLERIKSVLHV